MKLFAEVFPKGLVTELFQKRVEDYGSLIRRSAEIGSFHFHLTNLIILSTKSEIPVQYDFGLPKLSNEGAIESFDIKQKITLWELVFMPTFFETLEDYNNYYHKNL